MPPGTNQPIIEPSIMALIRCIMTFLAVVICCAIGSCTFSDYVDMKKTVAITDPIANRLTSVRDYINSSYNAKEDRINLAMAIIKQQPIPKDIFVKLPTEVQQAILTETAVKIGLAASVSTNTP